MGFVKVSFVAIKSKSGPVQLKGPSSVGFGVNGLSPNGGSRSAASPAIIMAKSGNERPAIIGPGVSISAISDYERVKTIGATEGATQMSMVFVGIFRKAAVGGEKGPVDLSLRTEGFVITVSASGINPPHDFDVAITSSRDF